MFTTPFQLIGGGRFQCVWTIVCLLNWNELKKTDGYLYRTGRLSKVASLRGDKK